MREVKARKVAPKTQRNVGELFSIGITNLRIKGLDCDVSHQPNIGCHLQVRPSDGKPMEPFDMWKRIEEALTVSLELAEYWKPVIWMWSDRKSKNTDLYALTSRLLAMKK